MTSHDDPPNATPWPSPRTGFAMSERSMMDLYNVTMKAIKVTELKAHLSRYLRLASRGTRIVVQDRDEPIAELGPLDPTRNHGASVSPGRAGFVQVHRAGARSRFPQFAGTSISQAPLRDIREDPSEIRRR
jgi:antitoxin (DNA-binding transcriptional repressor) of toxin-antitoxin stability system